MTCATESRRGPRHTAARPAARLRQSGRHFVTPHIGVRPRLAWEGPGDAGRLDHGSESNDW